MGNKNYCGDCEHFTVIESTKIAYGQTEKEGHCEKSKLDFTTLYMSYFPACELFKTKKLK